MNRSTIGIFTIGAGFLLIWGAYSGTLGKTWTALTGKSLPTNGTTPGSVSTPTGGQTCGDGFTLIGSECIQNQFVTPCAPGYIRSPDGRCLTAGGGEGPPNRSMTTLGLGTNGLMSVHGSGSV